MIKILNAHLSNRISVRNWHLYAVVAIAQVSALMTVDYFSRGRVVNTPVGEAHFDWSGTVRGVRATCDGWQVRLVYQNSELNSAENLKPYVDAHLDYLKDDETGFVPEFKIYACTDHTLCVGIMVREHHAFLLPMDGIIEHFRSGHQDGELFNMKRIFAQARKVE